MGYFDIQGWDSSARDFGRFARSEGISEEGITSTVSSLTGKSFESSVMELNMIPSRPLK